MYAGVPSNADFLNGANSATLPRNRGNDGGGGVVVVGTQLPSFDAVFVQNASHPFNNSAIRYNNGLRNYQEHQSAFQQVSMVRQNFDQLSTPNNNYYGYQHQSTSHDYDNYYGNHTRSAFVGPPMALLPTVPASSLLAVNKLPIQQPFQQADTSAHSRLTSNDSTMLSWNNAPPYRNVAIQQPKADNRTTDLRNGFSTAANVDKSIIDNHLIKIRNNGHQNRTLPLPIATTRTVEENEAAATLAEFFLSANNSPTNLIQNRKFDNNGYLSTDRHAALQRYEQQQGAKTFLQGDTAAATAAKIVQMTQLHQRFKFPGFQNGSTIPYVHDSGFNRDVVPPTFPVQMQNSSFDATNSASAKLSDDRLAKEREFYYQQQQNNFKNQDQRSLLPQQSIDSQFYTDHRYQNHLNSSELSAAASSSLPRVVTEFIRQLDPPAVGIGFQQSSQQHNLQPERRIIDQRPVQFSRDQQFSNVQHQPLPQQQPQQQQVFIVDLRRSSSSSQSRSDTSEPPSTSIDQRSSFLAQQQETTSNAQQFSRRSSVVEPTASLETDKSIAWDQLNLPTDRSIGLDRLNSTIDQTPTTQAIVATKSEISNCKISKSVDAKIRTVNGGKISKKSASIKIRHLKKQTKSITSKLENGSLIDNRSSIEFQFPKLIEPNPLLLSPVGLLLRLIKNSSRVALLAKKQLSSKNSKYYDKLPTMFGLAAASLSSSNGASIKKIVSNLSAEINKSIISDQQQPRPGGSTFMNGKKHVYAKIPVVKQELATALSDRIAMPDGTLESEESLRNRLENNITQPVATCTCLSPVDEEVEGPYYTHLAAAASVEKMRLLIEERYGEKGSAVRIEKIRHTKVEGRTADGCPIAKWVIRRGGPEEKILCVVRHRPHHFCSTAVIAVIIVIWDGVVKQQADDLYSYLVDVLPTFGVATNRRCETNEKRLCACQGIIESIGGASFSFGCSWSMYSNTCKFCKSILPRKFKLTSEPNDQKELRLEEKCHKLADAVAPLFKRMAPACYRNQTYFSDRAQPCRLGYVPRGPFSGITACADFCAHAHKDIHNMNNGCTVVVTLTKHRGFDKPDDEQLHVLPLCVLDSTDEYGSQEDQWKKTQNGSLEVLGAYPMNLRLRRNPLPCCRERTKQQKQKPGRPTKSKQARLDTNVQRTVEKCFNFQSTNSNTVLDWPNFNAINNDGNNEQKQRLPSMNTFTQFASLTPSTSTTSDGFFQYSNGPYSNNGIGANRPTPAYYPHDLAGFAQGYRTPTSSSNWPQTDHDRRVDSGETDESIYEAYTDNREAFQDARVGGVAVALTHGSVLLEVAKRELHATTALKTPDRRDPKRISLVFYQHKHLNYSNHGQEELEKKKAEKLNLKQDDEIEAAAAEAEASDDEIGDRNRKSKREENEWPILDELKTGGEWQVVGAKNLCTTLIRDNLVTASSSTSKSFECRPTQKYQRQVSTFKFDGK